MTFPNLVRLAQGQLNLLTTCPPWFQKNLVDQWPMTHSSEQQAKLTWGKNFHTLMQQRQLGLDIEPFLAQDPELARIFSALSQRAPELFNHSQTSYPEHCRTLKHGNYLLTVVYDLLILESQQAQIIDWKTYPQPPGVDKIRNNWQTRLYLYLLAETSPYPPEKLSFTYWFVRQPSSPQSLTFNYTQEQHQQAKQDLDQILSDLDQWLVRYQEQGDDFPHRPDCQTHCPYASYFRTDSESLSESPIKLEEISEIPL